MPNPNQYIGAYKLTDEGIRAVNKDRPDMPIQQLIQQDLKQAILRSILKHDLAGGTRSSRPDQEGFYFPWKVSVHLMRNIELALFELESLGLIHSITPDDDVMFEGSSPVILTQDEEAHKSIYMKADIFDTALPMPIADVKNELIRYIISSYNIDREPAEEAADFLLDTFREIHGVPGDFKPPYTKEQRQLIQEHMIQFIWHGSEAMDIRDNYDPRREGALDINIEDPTWAPPDIEYGDDDDFDRV